MRIGHIIESHTVYTHRLASAQVALGHEVEVFCFHDRVRDSRSSYRVNQIEVSPWQRNLPYSHHWAGMVRLLSAVRIFNPEIVHGHYLSTSALYSLLTPVGTKVVSAIGSDILIDTREAHARFLVRLASRSASRVISSSDEITSALEHLGVPSYRLRTIPMGVDSNLFSRLVPPVHGLGKPLLVSTRALEPVYRPDRLIRAMPEILKDLPRTCLVFVGDGSLRSRLESLVQKLRVSDSVVFIGPVHHSEVPSYLAAADSYVSAAISDGTSTSLLEAMAMGRLPVVTDIPANRSWIANGENGLLVPLEGDSCFSEAITRGLQDQSLRERAARQNPVIVAERAAWDHTVEQIDRVYREALRK